MSEYKVHIFIFNGFDENERLIIKARDRYPSGAVK